MTDKAHHCTFFHLEVISHFCTLDTIAAKLSGSDFIMASNSENFPGLKKTLVTPNLKSFSVIPSACSSAYETINQNHTLYNFT